MRGEMEFMDFRHAEKPRDIKPQDITPEDIADYREHHELGPNASDEIVKQLIIAKRGGAIYAQENWDQPLDPKDKTRLAYEGIRHAQAFADEVYQDMDLSPRGRVRIFMASPVGRTQETMAVIEDRIDYRISHDRPRSLEAVKLAKLDPQALRGHKDGNHSYIIFNHEAAEKLEPFMGKAHSKLAALGVDETGAEMLWFCRPDELAMIKQEIARMYPQADLAGLAGVKPGDFVIPPEEHVLKVITHYMEVMDFAEKNFSGQQVEVNNIGHNMVFDATTIRLLGFDLSGGAVGKLGGKARDYLEGAKLTIADGKLTVSYRGFARTYSEEEFKDLKNKLQDEAAARKKEWQSQ